MAELPLPQAPRSITEAINLAGPKTWSLHRITKKGKRNGGILVMDTEGHELCRFDGTGRPLAAGE